MHPIDLRLSKLELAILRHLAVRLPSLNAVISTLRVRSRDLSKCGSFTNFKVSEPVVGASAPLSITVPIKIPALQYGLGAILFFNDGRPDFLEIFTFGEEVWDGSTVNFDF